MIQESYSMLARMSCGFVLLTILASNLAACGSGTSETIPGSNSAPNDGGTSPSNDGTDGGPGVDAHPEETTDDASADAGATYETLPFSGGKSAPVVASLTFKCDSGGVHVAIVVTDPEGPDDLAGQYYQTVGLFASATGLGPAETHTFYVTGTGSYFDGNVTGRFFANSPLKATICAADTWPATVTVVDNTGHSTIGKVRATRTL